MRLFRSGRQHDPECDAARYLAEGAGRAWREGFERHLLECEACWGEVRAARRGRALADRARELAPPELREAIRAAVPLPPSDRQRQSGRRYLAAVAIVMTGIAGLLLARPSSPDQPAAVEAALAAYRGEALPLRALAGPPPDLSSAGLRLESSGRRHLAELTADLYRFTAPDGRRVLVLVSDRDFPEPPGARGRAGVARGWRAVSDGVTMLCADAPVSYLVLSDARELAERAEAALRTEVIARGWRAHV